jgi:hypothetical protein
MTLHSFDAGIPNLERPTIKGEIFYPLTGKRVNVSPVVAGQDGSRVILHDPPHVFPPGHV